MYSSKLVERMVVSSGRPGFSHLYNENVRHRGILGQLYLLMFGTPQLGSFANGIYLKRVLRRHRFTSILDAGCGSGTFTFYCARHYPEAKVLGIDIGEQGVHSVETTLDLAARAQKQLRFPNVRFERMDLLDLGAEGEFDFAFSFDVLEHIPDNRRAIENIYRALRPGGRLLLRIPTREQKRILNPKYTAEFEKWSAVEHVGQTYDMDTLLTDMRAIGFKIESAEYCVGFWGRLSFELAEAFKYYRLPEPAYFASVPFLKALRWVDTVVRPSSGDGLLVLGRK